MSKVLAAIDNSAAARSVLVVAAAVADLVGADVDAIHVQEDGCRTARAAAEAAGVSLHVSTTPGMRGLVEAADDPGVSQVVLGARSTQAGRRPAGHVALALASSVDKPLVVVPPDVPLPFALRRILVPLDGSRATADALEATVRLACRSKLEVISLHVHEQPTLPLFSDQPQHEVDAWTREFLRRHCPHPELVMLESRVGVPGENVLRVARESRVDMVALGWSQKLDGRAAVVREVLAGSAIPVLLVPIHDQSGDGTALRRPRSSSRFADRIASRGPLSRTP